MGNQIDFSSISDRDARTFVEDHIEELSIDVKTTLQQINAQPDSSRKMIHETGELTFQPSRSMPVERGIDFVKIKKSILAGIWHTLCSIKSDDKNKGEARKEILDLFNKDGIGSEIIKAAIIAAFTALGSVWGGFGAVIGTALGTKVKDWVIGIIASQLDIKIEKELTEYCKIVPAA